MQKTYPQHNEITQSVAEEATAYGTPSASTAALVDMYVRPLANLADNIKLEIIQRLTASLKKKKEAKPVREQFEADIEYLMSYGKSLHITAEDRLHDERLDYLLSK